jgi:hypothetical protein
MKTLTLLVCFVLMVTCAYAGAPVSTLGKMADEVRILTGLESTSLLPDSSLNQFCAEALVWTSTDIGGVEFQFRFVTVAEQAYYAIPDTITEVLYASFRTQEGGTRSIKAWYPQFFEDLQIGDLNNLNPSENDLPYAYHYWSDTVQLLPAPARADDTVTIAGYVEHRLVTDDSMTINMTPAFTEAAVYYAASKALFSVKQSDRSNACLTIYAVLKQSLSDRFTRRFDVMKRQ